MDGDELARILRAREDGRSLFIIAVTAMSNEAAKQRLAEFDMHLVKPVPPDQLLTIVDRFRAECEA
jgi:CheY-like chemotaxis protein